MGGYVAAGFLFGQWLDGVFETTPWLTFLYLGLGIFAAGRSVWRATKKWRRELHEQAKDEVRSARPLVSGRWHSGAR